MEFIIRPIQGAEHLYCYYKSEDISKRTGLIGHLRSDMSTDGLGFFTSFFDFRPALKSEIFRAELQEVIDNLRYNGCLKSRTALSAFCRKHPEADLYKTGSDSGIWHSYGFRVDTEQHSFMFRFTPHKGEYEVYCYCYVRQWLESHMKSAAKGIRFITQNEENLFVLEDGGQIGITGFPEDGRTEIRSCRYIDKLHFQTGSLDSQIYNIKDFTEKMKRYGYTIAPVLGHTVKEA